MDPFVSLNRSVMRALGVEVSYQQGTAAPFIVKGVPMKDSDEERYIGGLYTRLLLNQADFQTLPAQGDVVTIAGTAYTVFESKADATGGIMLSLRAVT